MGWLRTNWLDALIFLLVAAIMAGVVFFLTGVNPLSAIGGGQPQTSAPAPSTSKPTPQTKPQANPKPQAQSDANSNPETVVTVVPVTPAQPAQPEPKPVPAPPKVGDNASAPPQANAQPQTPSVSANPDQGGAWRIAVGSFAQAANANRLAASLRSQGYPVSLETSGNLTRLWVGPYSSQGKAQSVADGLSQYSPKVMSAPAGSANQGQSTSSSNSGPSTTSSSPSTATTRAARFLQVGAYKTRESAAPAMERVKDAGYNPVLVEENGLVKVRVGPLDDPASAKAALRARGLDVLEVR